MLHQKIFFRASFIVIGILIIGIAVFGFFFTRTVVAAFDGRDALVRAKEAVLEMDFERAVGEIRRASASFDRVASGVRALQFVERVPWIGARLRVSVGLLQSGREVIRALFRITEIGSELVRLSGLTESEIKSAFDGTSTDITFEALPPETKRAILRRLSAAANDFFALHTSLILAEAEIKTVTTDPITLPYFTMLDSWRSKLAETRSLIETVAIASGLLPQFLGLEKEKDTLLLFLNNNELRPGGGFIGTYGVITMKDGEMTDIRTADSYRLDRAAEPFLKTIPPVPIQKHLAVSGWFFRDANWSPDFALSARKATELWNVEARLVPSVEPPRSFENVVGFTPTLVSSLLKIIGPLRIAGQVFTAENIADRLEYQVEQGYVGQRIPESQRKEILADLVSLMKAKLYALPLVTWKDVLAAIQEAFRTKQFVLYSDDQAVEEILARVGWGGRVLPQTADVQMVVDANLASLKSDQAVSRSVRYEVFRNTDKQFVGRTSIRYEHHGQFDWKTTRYRTYTRLFAPKGSKLIRVDGTLAGDLLQNPSRAPGVVDVASDLELTSFGAFTSVEPGQAQELVFEYLLAPEVVESIESKHYRLSWFKQIGAQEAALTLTLDFDKNITFAAPAETESAWGDDVYRVETTINEDRVFVVEL